MSDCLEYSKQPFHPVYTLYNHPSTVGSGIIYHSSTNNTPQKVTSIDKHKTKGVGLRRCSEGTDVCRAGWEGGGERGRGGLGRSGGWEVRLTKRTAQSAMHSGYIK